MGLWPTSCPLGVGHRNRQLAEIRRREPARRIANQRRSTVEFAQPVFSRSPPSRSARYEHRIATLHQDATHLAVQLWVIEQPPQQRVRHEQEVHYRSPASRSCSGNASNKTFSTAPTSRPGQHGAGVDSGTSRGTGLPLFAMVIFSAARTHSINCDRCVFASFMFTVSFISSPQSCDKTWQTRIWTSPSAR